MRKVWIIIVLCIGIGLITFLVVSNKPPVAIPEVVEKEWPEHTIIGTSVEGRVIDAYTYGDGETHLAFIGGVHGGYEWNTVVLAYRLMDYLDANPALVPENLTVTIIPSANPDGVHKVTGKEGRIASTDIPASIDTAPGRFNARGVDLNRNFDCKWQPESMWRSKVVSAGSKPFSEPEALAIKNFVLLTNPRAVIFWHSQAGAVYASECKGGILPETTDIMNAYAKASGYEAVPSFDAYETTGDADGWLASIGVPSITVEFKTHQTVEWEENLAGVMALFKYYK